MLLLKDNFKQFFLHIKCPNTCKEFLINFEFTNNIDINNNENYSFDTKNKKYNFKVKLNFGKIKKVYFAFILTGKNIIKGTSMKIGNIQAKGLLKNSLVLFNNQNSLNSTLVDINLNMAGEIKIIFKIYENKNNINKIELNKNDFYFLVPKKNNTFIFDYGKKQICSKYELTLSSINDVKAKFFNIGGIPKESVIKKTGTIFEVSSKNISINTLVNVPSLVLIKLNIIKKLECFNLKKDLYNFHTFNNYTLRKNGRLIGFKFNIKKIKGKINIYKIICKNDNDCIINFDLNFLEEKENEKGEPQIEKINLINNNKDIPFYLSSDKNNSKNGLIIYCLESQCNYELTYTPKINEIIILNNNNKVFKYFNSSIETNYSITLKNLTKKIKIIDLIVLSGYAYMKENKQNITVHKEFLGNNKRIRFKIGLKQIKNDINFEFSVKTGKEGAVYYLFNTELGEGEKNKILPLGISTIESFEEKIENFKFIDIEKINKKNNILTFFNPINCDFTIRENLDKIEGENFFNLNKKNVFNYQLKKDQYNENQKCLFFVGSVLPLNPNSFLILQEGKSLRFKLSDEMKILRTKFYYIFNSKRNFPFYIRISLINNIPIKLTIELKKKKNIYNLLK